MPKIFVKGTSGKMGSRIEELAKKSHDFLVVSSIEGADVLIDFSHPDATIPNLELAAQARKCAVIGTTGQTAEQMRAIEKMASKLPFVFSPNMSVGVNVMWEILAHAATTLGAEFHPFVKETHHIHKKDSPSGTAKKIAEVIAKNLKIDPSQVPIESIREGEVVGDHTTRFESPEEILEITHRALSRDPFALGALRAARWIVGKPNGLYSMGDVLGLKF